MGKDLGHALQIRRVGAYAQVPQDGGDGGRDAQHPEEEPDRRAAPARASSGRRGAARRGRGGACGEIHRDRLGMREAVGPAGLTGAETGGPRPSAAAVRARHAPQTPLARSSASTSFPPQASHVSTAMPAAELPALAWRQPGPEQDGASSARWRTRRRAALCGGRDGGGGLRRGVIPGWDRRARRRRRRAWRRGRGRAHRRERLLQRRQRRHLPWIRPLGLRPLVRLGSAPRLARQRRVLLDVDVAEVDGRGARRLEWARRVAGRLAHRRNAGRRGGRQVLELHVAPPHHELELAVRLPLQLTEELLLLLGLGVGSTRVVSATRPIWLLPPEGVVRARLRPTAPASACTGGSGREPPGGRTRPGASTRCRTVHIGSAFVPAGVSAGSAARR
jgi:hypothetical protein